MKKTSGAMCDELGNDDHMIAYVEEYGGTSICDASSEFGCNEKEVDYIKKMKAASDQERVAQLARLEGMDGKMKPALKSWVNKRIKILKQLVPSDEL